MFVPIDLLPPIYQELVDTGRAQKNAKPWLGMQTTEALGHLVVSGVHDGGPADKADVQVGDIIEEIETQICRKLARHVSQDMGSRRRRGRCQYQCRTRGSRQIDIVIRSGDRHDYLKVPRRH